MTEVYGITKKGIYHEKNDQVCQDFHKILKKGEFVFAAVADGVGSNTHSHIASEIGATESVNYCAEHIDGNQTEKEILEIIRESFLAAKIKIDLRAKEEKEKSPEEHEEYQFHTTLTLAIYKDGKLFYGQAGDSGILALTTEGKVELVTIQQRDEEGRVFPLAYGEKYWKFGIFEEKAASVLLATDGMLEAMIPKCLVIAPVKIYVAMACYFMDNAILQLSEKKLEEIRNSRESYMENVIAKEICDDLTIAVIVDMKQRISYRENEYYDIPPIIRERNEEKEKCEYQEAAEENMSCQTKLQAEEKEEFSRYVVKVHGLPKFTALKSVLQKLKRK